MPPCPLAESELRVEMIFSTLSRAKDTESRSSGVNQGRIGTETQDLEANTELRHSSFSGAELAVVPFEVREVMEGEHTPETDLTRYHQVLEGGDQFESSFLTLDR